MKVATSKPGKAWYDGKFLSALINYGYFPLKSHQPCAIVPPRHCKFLVSELFFQKRMLFRCFITCNVLKLPVDEN